MKKHFIGLALSMILCGCGGSSGSGSTNPVIPTAKNHLYLGTIATIPIGLVANTVVHNSKSAQGGLKSYVKTHPSLASALNLAANSGSITYITVVNNLEVTANLINIQVKGDASVQDKPSQFIDTTACQKVVPHGLCNIIINPPNQNGSFALTVNYDVGSSSQMVSYQKNMPPVNGFIFKNSNNLLVNKELAERSAFTVPFVLAHDLSLIKVSSNKPGFVNTKVICNGASSNQGNLCTILGEVQANTPNGAVAVTLTGVLLNSEEEVTVTFPVIVNNEQSPNLVTTGANVVVNSGSSQSVTVLNNGNVEATGIQFKSNSSPININTGSGGCASLLPGQACSVTVSSNEAQNFQGSVSVSWSGSGKSGSTSFNVVYIAAESSPGIEFVTSGNLTYTTVDKASDYAVHVINNGSVLLSNIKPVNVTSVSPTLTYVTPPEGEFAPCATDGSQELASGATCVLQIHYQPIEIESATFDFMVTGDYYNSAGDKISYSPGREPITYSSIASPANLVANPSIWSFAIRADNLESVIESFEISNSGSIATKIEDIQLVGSNLTQETGPAACEAGTTVLEAASANSCKIYVKYGPKVSDESGINHVIIKYKATPVVPVASIESLTIPVHYFATIAALVKVTDISVTNATSGSGSAQDPFNFFNSPSNQLKTTITYKNVGTLQADNFNVNLANLRIGLAIDSATCGYGDSTTSLLPNEECTLVLKAVDDRIYNYLYLTGELSLLIPGFSYTDSNTGLNIQAAPFYEPLASNEVSILANSFASVITDGANVNASGSAQSQAFDLVFTSKGGNPDSYPITITVLGTGGMLYADGEASCTINSAAENETCSIPLQATAGTPAGNYIFQYKVTPVGSTSGYLHTLQVSVE